MRVIPASYEFIDEPDVFKKLEICGRTAYKSEEKITEDSAEKFVKMLLNRKHMSVFRHVYGKFCTHKSNRHLTKENMQKLKKYCLDIIPSKDFDSCTYVGNMQVLLEVFAKDHSLVEKLAYLCLPDSEVDDIVTVRFICDRGISHELVRHTVAGITQESTRYCDYSGEVAFIKPCFAPSVPLGCYSTNLCPSGSMAHVWTDAALQCERSYMALRHLPASPQHARSVLINSVKTELVMTMTLGQWRHFFDVRALGKTGAPHPQMLELTLPLLEEFGKRYGKQFQHVDGEWLHS